MIPLKPEQLRGSITPIITPFRDGQVDYNAYAELVTRHVRLGGHGVLVNGTSAEPSTLTVAERNKLVDVALQCVGGKTQVIAATGSQSHAETIALSEHAARAGVDALLVVTPYYIRPPQRGLVHYYLDLAKRTELPILVYHIPGRTAVSVTLDTLKQIADKATNFVGIKHAVNDLGFVTECLAYFGKEFRIFVGLEELSFPMLAVGACGLMNAVGNLVPAAIARLYDAVRLGRLEEARELHFRLFELNQAVFFDTNPIPIKYMARKLGLIPTNEHRLPMLPATEDVAVRLDAVLARAQDIVSNA
jgi:4-hydroxy-tetrahydrodipicolinate synthase